MSSSECAIQRWLSNEFEHIWHTSFSCHGPHWLLCVILCDTRCRLLTRPFHYGSINNTHSAQRRLCRGYIAYEWRSRMASALRANDKVFHSHSAQRHTSFNFFCILLHVSWRFILLFSHLVGASNGTHECRGRQQYTKKKIIMSVIRLKPQTTVMDHSILISDNVAPRTAHNNNGDDFYDFCDREFRWGSPFSTIAHSNSTAFE